MISTGITRLANGMNQRADRPPGTEAGRLRRPSASLFLAARNIQMMKSTTIATWTSTNSADAALTKSSASSSPLAGCRRSRPPRTSWTTEIRLASATASSADDAEHHPEAAR